MFQLPKLDYNYSALEPHIDAQTMEIHYLKHHAGYVKGLNEALEGSGFEDKNLDELLRGVSGLPEEIKTKVRNTGGGHYNHSLFWKVLGKPANGRGKDGKGVSDKLGQAIDGFGGMDKLKEDFSKAALTRFGSGWAWLGVKEGKLIVCSTPNQDNPLMKGIVECECKPILGLDVWEHAYYLKYQNRRAEYIENFWKVVNWRQVEESYGKVA